MDRLKAKKLLDLYGHPRVGNLVFARQDEQDINKIEQMSKQKLKDHWKSLVWLNEIYGQIDLNDMQRISLLELEMDKKITQKEKDTLTKWYKRAKTQREIEEAQEIAEYKKEKTK